MVVFTRPAMRMPSLALLLGCEPMRIAMLLHKSVEYDSRVRREARALARAGHKVTVIELDAEAYGTLDGFTRVSAAPPPWVRRALPFQAAIAPCSSRPSSAGCFSCART